MHPAARKPRPALEPRGELASRTLAMPAHTNPRGDIFGGWIMVRHPETLALCRHPGLRDHGHYRREAFRG